MSFQNVSDKGEFFGSISAHLLCFISFKKCRPGFLLLQKLSTEETAVSIQVCFLLLLCLSPILSPFCTYRHKFAEKNIYRMDFFFYEYLTALDLYCMPLRSSQDKVNIHVCPDTYRISDGKLCYMVQQP